jgi:hypothetical protein
MYPYVPTACIALALGLSTACAPARVLTTPAPVPAPGSPIRYAVRSDPFRFTTGRMISLDADTLAFERFVPGDRSHWVADRIPTDSVAQLQARVGRRANGGRGALIGGGIGAALGALCASSYNEDEFVAFTPGQCLFSGVVTGAAAGLLVGSLTRADVWAPVPLPARGPVEVPKPPLTAAAQTGDGIAE